MPLSVVQRLLKLGVLHNALLLPQLVHGDLEELLLPEHLSGDEDLRHLLRLKLGLLDFLTDQVDESVQLVLVGSVAERVNPVFFPRQLPRVEGGLSSSSPPPPPTPSSGEPPLPPG